MKGAAAVPTANLRIVTVRVIIKSNNELYNLDNFSSLSHFFSSFRVMK